MNAGTHRRVFPRHKLRNGALRMHVPPRVHSDVGRVTSLAAVMVLVAACQADASAEQSSPPSPPQSAGPSAEVGPSASASASASAVVATPSASASVAATPARPGLAADTMARVIAESVVMREAPGRDSEFVRVGCYDVPQPCAPVLLGPAAGIERLFIVEGPVAADGYEWYLAGTSTDNAIGAQYVGWVPEGDTAGPWVVTMEVACPEEPIGLADVTLSAIGRLELLSCIGDRELTLRGWYPEPPPDICDTPTCVPQDAVPEICSFGAMSLRPIEAPWAGDANHLGWWGDSGAELPHLERNTWIVVTGHFDHDMPSWCNGSDAVKLNCRLEFVVTSVAPG